MVWTSPSQIARLNTSEHWYIDSTFRVCPKPDSQLLIIMSRDAVFNTTSPGCYVLTNSKILFHTSFALRIKDISKKGNPNSIQNFLQFFS